MKIQEVYDRVTENDIIQDVIPNIVYTEIKNDEFEFKIGECLLTFTVEDDLVVVTDTIFDDYDRILDQVVMSFDDIDESVSFVIQNYMG